MPLRFQPYEDRTPAYQAMQQTQFNQLNDTLGNISNQAIQSRQDAMRQALQQKEQDRQNELMAMKRDEFNRSKSEWEREHTVTPMSPEMDYFASNSLTQKNPNPMTFPSLGQTTQPNPSPMPKKSLSLFQGGAQQPEMASDLVAAHKAKFPHLAGIPDQYAMESQQPGMPPPGFSPKSYKDFLEQQKTISSIGETKAKTMEHLSKASNVSKYGSEYGKAPTGFRWTTNGELESIPGGPADLKSQADKQKSDLALASQKDKANLIIQKIDQALSKVGNLSAGFGSITKGIPMTPAKNLSADLETIKALLGFEQLGEMKNQSRAGASGLGALSDREMSLLTAARANLDQAQDPDQLRERLNEVKTHFSNWLKMEEGINPYSSNQSGGAGMIRFQDSQGGIHDIPASNLEKARQRDPGLKVIQ